MKALLVCTLLFLALIVNVAGLDAICDLSSVTGPCEAYFRRFYYDHLKGSCQQFIYGGCGGNQNNFHTIEECNARCHK